MEWQRRPPGGLLPGDPPRRDPRRWSAPTTGCRGRPNPHRRGRGAWTASSTWLKDLDPGRGGGLLLGPCVRRSGQQGGARGVLIVEGAPPLESEARGGMRRAGRPARGRPGRPGPTPWSPPAWSTPVRATRAVRRPQGTARGSPPPGARACTAPDEEAARRAPGAFRQSDPGPRAPADGGDVGEGLGEEHRLPGLPPGPAPGHLHHQRDRVAEPTEPRGPPRGAATISSDEAAARTAVAGGSATPEGPPGRPARQR